MDEEELEEDYSDEEDKGQKRAGEQAGFMNRVAGATLITVGLSVQLSLRHRGSMQYQTNIFPVEIAGTFSLIVECLSNNVPLVICLLVIT